MEVMAAAPGAAGLPPLGAEDRVWAGEGTGVAVCLHGDPGSPEDFRHLAEALRGRFAAVVALRLPNFRAVDLSRGKDRRGGPGLVFAESQCILQKSRESDTNI